MFGMPTSQKTACIGFTLVEVLIAVVILSIGMLGLMGMQTLALRQNNSAQTRTYAIDFINELADRIRANRAGVNDYLAAPANPGFDCVNSYPGGGTVCNPQQMARADMYAWTTSANTVFPGAQTRATLTCTDSRDPGFSDTNGDGINDTNTDGNPCTDGSLFLITLSWDDDRSGTPMTTFQVSFVP